MLGNLFYGIDRATLKSVGGEEGSYYTKIFTLYINKAGFYNIMIILLAIFYKFLHGIIDGKR